MLNENRHQDGIYQQIFSKVSNGDQLRTAIALAVRELRASMEKEDNSSVTKAHVRNLQDLDPICLAHAYSLAEKTCIYWPNPGQIRELAGYSDQDEAARALEWVFTYLQGHGVDGKPKGGGVTFADDGAGRRVMTIVQPTADAPELPPRILQPLTRLGGGSYKQGLSYCSQHPSVQGWEEARTTDSPHKIAERIERQWARCYQQTLRTPSQL